MENLKLLTVAGLLVASSSAFCSQETLIEPSIDYAACLKKVDDIINVESYLSETSLYSDIYIKHTIPSNEVLKEILVYAESNDITYNDILDMIYSNSEKAISYGYISGRQLEKLTQQLADSFEGVKK